MKIVAVVGSPTNNGNTSKLAREVLRGAQNSGAEIEEIFLADHKIQYCRGCLGKIKNTCMSTGKCNIDDDVKELKQILYSSDGIVLATPCYARMPTAMMKNFISDRIGMFTAYTSSLGGKYFVGVSCCGGIGANKVAKDIAKDFIMGFHQRGYFSGHLGVALGYDKVDTKPEVLLKAYNLGVKLANDIKKKRKYPFQNLIGRLMIILFVKKIILKNIYNNRDGDMKAVYENLTSRGMIKPAGNKGPSTC